MKILVHVENLADPEGSQRTVEQVFEQSEVTLGRSKTSNLVLAASDVSNRHARLFVETSKETGRPVLYVVDVGSSNGTFIEDLRLAANEPFELNAGQRLVMGSFLLSPELQLEPSELAVEPLPEPVVEAAAEPLDSESADSGLKAASAAGHVTSQELEPVAELSVAEPIVQANAPEETAGVIVAPTPPEVTSDESSAQRVTEVLEVAGSESSNAVEQGVSRAVLEQELAFAGSAIQLFCERISHALRTPLGVAINTVADARASGALDEVIVSDGEQAHQTILTKLHFLNFLGQPFVVDKQRVEISDVLFSELSVRPLLQKLNVELTAEAATAVGDGALLARAVEGIVRYATVRFARAGEPLRLSILICPKDESVLIQVRAIRPGLGKDPTLAQPASFSEIATKEEFLEGAALVFSELVARIHQGAVRRFVEGSDVCVFELSFPHA